jgi:hypothetical protein
VSFFGRIFGEGVSRLVGKQTISVSSRSDFTGNISVTDPSGQTMEGSLEMRGGQPALSAEVRAELERQGLDPALIESKLAEAKSATGEASSDAEPSGQPPAPQIERAPEPGAPVPQTE